MPTDDCDRSTRSSLWTPRACALWQDLRGFDLDVDGAAFPFSARLARDNGWSQAYAERVAGEYRRFLFLAMTAGHPVTPSDEVDQAWHLHLTYTRSYWDDLCGGVLGQPLHHGPTKGGDREREKFVDWYARTLASYELWFCQAPPTDVWPPSKQRFGRAPHFQRINTRDWWMVPRSRVSRLAALAATSSAALLFACAAAAGASGGGDLFVALVLVAIAVGFVWFVMHSSGGRGNGGWGGDGGGCGGAGGGFWFGNRDSDDSDDSGCSGCSGCAGCGGCGGCGS